MKAQMDRPDYAKHILHLLIERDMKQADLAYEIGLSRQYVWMVLRGQVDPNPAFAGKIETALELDEQQGHQLHRMCARHHGWRV